MCGNPIHDNDRDEWRAAVRDMTETERAPWDDPQIYTDTMAPDGTRYGEQ